MAKTGYSQRGIARNFQNLREDLPTTSIETLTPALLHFHSLSTASEPMTSKLLPTFAIGLGLILVGSGCNPSESPSSDTKTPAAEMDHDQMDHDHSEHDHSDGEHANMTDMEKMTAALADFSEEDRTSAMQQHYCPVTGDMLGTMGAPQKVDVQGRQVWICCDSCRDQLLAEPAKYFAKLDE